MAGEGNEKHVVCFPLNFFALLLLRQSEIKNNIGKQTFLFSSHGNWFDFESFFLFRIFHINNQYERKEDWLLKLKGRRPLCWRFHICFMLVGKCFKIRKGKEASNHRTHKEKNWINTFEANEIKLNISFLRKSLIFFSEGTAYRFFLFKFICLR